jgi:uncharacterized protein with GYD domain
MSKGAIREITPSSSGASMKAVVETPRPFARRSKLPWERSAAHWSEYYIALGPVEVIAIYDAPDAITAASVSMTLGALGAASSVETMQLFTMEEAMTAMARPARYRRATSRQPPPSLRGVYRTSGGQAEPPRYARGSPRRRHGGLPRRSTAPVQALRCARQRSGETPPRG